ncbi:hypothetical protein, partial [Oleiphilus sp. HI0128]
MSGLLIAFVTIILGVLVCVKAMSSKKRKHIEALYTNIGLVKNLKVLLIFIQQHRGLTTGYLHGDRSLDNAVRQAKQRVDNQWRVIEN